MNGPDVLKPRDRFAGLLAVLAIIGSSCGVPVAECSLDADCTQGQACDQSACVAICETDDQCLDSEECRTGLTTSARTCQAASSGDGTDVVSSRFVLIRDVTEGVGCQTADPGSDLAFVALEALDGEVLAWGSVVHAELVLQGNDFASWDHIDGQPPSYGGDSCPDFDPGNVVALGCGGAIVVEFPQGGGATDLVSGQGQVRVAEYGGQCDGGTADDAYEVMLCPGQSDPTDANCTVRLGEGQGEKVFGI